MSEWTFLPWNTSLKLLIKLTNHCDCAHNDPQSKYVGLLSKNRHIAISVAPHFLNFDIPAPRSKEIRLKITKNNVSASVVCDFLSHCLQNVCLVYYIIHKKSKRAK